MTSDLARTDLLARLHRAARDYGDATIGLHAARATRLGLHPTDHKALGVLDRHGPLSAGELGRSTGLAAASVTNLIDRLAARGFVRREPDPVDRRRILLHVDVRALIDDESVASWRTSSAQSWQRYSDAELAVILQFLGDDTSRLRARTETIVDTNPRPHNGDHDDR